METNEMGRVVTEALIENLSDLNAVERGMLPEGQVRRLSVVDALVDTGASMLSLPTQVIKKLGLTKSGSKRITTSKGISTADVYGGVRLTIQGRDCIMDVLEVPDAVPVLIGQLPLERLDFVVDPGKGRLIGNPAHGGEHIIEMY